MAQPGSDLRYSVRDWRAAHPLLLRIYEDTMPEESRRALFLPRHLTAWLIKKGHVRVAVEGGHLQAEAGEWLVLPPGRRRHDVAEGTRLWSAHFQFETHETAPSIRLPRAAVFRAAAFPRLARQAVGLLRAASGRLGAATHTYLPGQPASVTDYLAVQSAFFAWLEALLAALGSLGLVQLRAGDDVADRLRSHLDAMPLNRRPAPAELERVVSRSARHVNRLFRARFGVTPARYFDERRANYARDHLLNTSDRIKEIAAALGFRHLAQFSNWFARHEGCAPGTFRFRHSKTIAP